MLLGAAVGLVGLAILTGVVTYARARELFAATACSSEPVLLRVQDLPPSQFSVTADLRGTMADDPLPLTAGQVVLINGQGTGHQLFRPADGRLTIAFGLPFGASRTGEICGEDGALIRQVTFSRLVRCSGS